MARGDDQNARYIGSGSGERWVEAAAPPKTRTLPLADGFHYDAASWAASLWRTDEFYSQSDPAPTPTFEGGELGTSTDGTLISAAVTTDTPFTQVWFRLRLRLRLDVGEIANENGDGKQAIAFDLYDAEYNNSVSVAVTRSQNVLWGSPVGTLGLWTFGLGLSTLIPVSESLVTGELSDWYLSYDLTANRAVVLAGAVRQPSTAVVYHDAAIPTANHAWSLVGLDVVVPRSGPAAFGKVAAVEIVAGAIADNPFGLTLPD